jgi:hypothetical protein
MDICAWFKIANDLIKKTKIVNKLADSHIKFLVQHMDAMSIQISNQWQNTHETVKDQIIDNDLVNNDKLINDQKKVNQNTSNRSIDSKTYAVCVILVQTRTTRIERNFSRHKTQNEHSWDC